MPSYMVATGIGNRLFGIASERYVRHAAYLIIALTALGALSG